MKAPADAVRAATAAPHRRGRRCEDGMLRPRYPLSLCPPLRQRDGDGLGRAELDHTKGSSSPSGRCREGRERPAALPFRRSQSTAIVRQHCTRHHVTTPHLVALLCSTLDRHLFPLFSFTHSQPSQRQARSRKNRTHGGPNARGALQTGGQARGASDSRPASLGRNPNHSMRWRNPNSIVTIIAVARRYTTTHDRVGGRADWDVQVLYVTAHAVWPRTRSPSCTRRHLLTRTRPVDEWLRWPTPCAG